MSRLKPQTLLGAALFGAALQACASDESSAPTDSSAQAPVERSWQTLITGDWTLSAGIEDYVCIRKTVDKDLYVTAFDSINPQGTHHTFLTKGPATGPDGASTCDAAEINEYMLYGSGVGANPIEMPEGVGLFIEAGSQLLLNLHLFNLGEAELSGTSGVNIKTAETSQIEQTAQSINVNAFNIDIPPKQEWSTTSTCKFATDANVFGVIPHMHQLGKHMKIVAGDQTLHDGDYDFDRQLYYPTDPVAMNAGDSLQFSCRWNNPGERNVKFGSSSLDEMCAVGLFVYPASSDTKCETAGRAP